MAVFTHVGAEDIARFLENYGIGPLTSAKGIAEGVENSNYLIEAGGTRYILTLYEKRVDADDLPFFVAIINHLADAGNPVPRILPDANGTHVQRLMGRPACLIQYLPGISLSRPNGRQAYAAGAALARLHNSAADFVGGPANPQGPAQWRFLTDLIGARLDDILPGLHASVAHECDALESLWPRDLPTGVIHADLFPDNVLVLGDDVSGIIDFYFACRDITAYDFAVTHSAWCFSPDGSTPLPALAASLAKGYQSARPFSPAEIAAMPILARGAALRFLLTRAHDWLDTPENALVVKKDPIAYLRRLDTYRADTAGALFGFAAP